MDTILSLLQFIEWRGFLVIALIFIPLEVLLPLHEKQRFLRKGWWNDMFYLFVNGFPIKLGLIAIVGVALYLAKIYMPAGLREWVENLPLLVQIPLVLLIADLGFYTAHRTFHSVPFLWRFHAIHHSIEDLDWLAAHRVHPIDQIITMSCSLVPVFALGFSGEAIAIHALIYHWQALLLHSNIKIGFGPLDKIIASPHFHHWHHANERKAYDKNFAGQLSLIDRIFGTLNDPKRLPEAYGCDDPIPPYYHQQLLYPILPAQMARKDAATEAAPSPSASNT